MTFNHPPPKKWAEQHFDHVSSRRAVKKGVSCLHSLFLGGGRRRGAWATFSGGRQGKRTPLPEPAPRVIANIDCKKWEWGEHILKTRSLPQKRPWCPSWPKMRMFLQCTQKGGPRCIISSLFQRVFFCMLKEPPRPTLCVGLTSICDERGLFNLFLQLFYISCTLYYYYYTS